MNAINYNNRDLMSYKVIKTIFDIVLFMLLSTCSFVCKDKVTCVVTLSFFIKGGIY